jgi:hypothetical protein
MFSHMYINFTSELFTFLNLELFLLQKLIYGCNESSNIVTELLIALLFDFRIVEELKF